MWLRLRQIALVAEKLAPVEAELTDVLGIAVCYNDPGVAHFGLENALLPIGNQLLEVVAPIQENTAGGRYLTRRGGNGGYMVIEPQALDYIEDDSTVWEDEPLTRLAADGQLSAYRHRGFWQNMDTLRDRAYLEELWASREAPWKTWAEG